MSLNLAIGSNEHCRGQSLLFELASACPTLQDPAVLDIGFLGIAVALPRHGFDATKLVFINETGLSTVE